MRLSSGGTPHAGDTRGGPRRANWRLESLQSAMSLTLICPKCESSTELRGTMDCWYMTWCPECERLWRIEIWSLLDRKDVEKGPAKIVSSKL